MSVTPWEARMEAGSAEQWCGTTFRNKRQTWNWKELTCLIYLAHAFQTHLFTPFLPATPDFCCFSNIWWDIPFYCFFGFVISFPELFFLPSAPRGKKCFSMQWYREHFVFLQAEWCFSFLSRGFCWVNILIGSLSAGRDAPRVCCITSYDPLKGFLRRLSTNLGLSLSLFFFFCWVDAQAEAGNWWLGMLERLEGCEGWEGRNDAGRTWRKTWARKRNTSQGFKNLCLLFCAWFNSLHLSNKSSVWIANTIGPTLGLWAKPLY